MRARIALAAAIAAGCHDAAHGDPGAVARTAAVHRGEIVDRVVLTGALHAATAVELLVPSVDASQLTVRWVIDDGARVKAGEPVVAFDSTAFTGKLIESHAQLRQAEAQFRLFQDGCGLHVADKQLEVRKQQHAVDRARLQVALPSDLLTARAIENNQLALRRAEAGLVKVDGELATMLADNALERRVQQIDLDRTRGAIATAERAIDALVVKAPRDGVIVLAETGQDSHKLRAGELVQDGAAIASLPDLDRPMEVRAELIDVDDGRVAPGARGTCTLDAYPGDALPCAVTALAPVARVKDGLISQRRTFAVTLALGRGDPARLRPGMAVAVELPRPAVHALVIPRGAISGDRAPDSPRARVTLDSGAVRDVTLAGCDEQRCAISDGLADGEVVSLEPTGGSGGSS